MIKNKSRKSRNKTRKCALKTPFSKGRKIQLGVTAVFAFLLSAMTIGYAVVPYYFSAQGRANFRVDGQMRIVSVEPSNLPHPARNISASPSFTHNEINLRALYDWTDPNSPDGEISFRVSVKNDLPIKRCFYEEPYVMEAFDVSGAQVHVDYRVELRGEDGVNENFNRCLGAGASSSFILHVYVKPDPSLANSGSSLNIDLDLKLAYLEKEPGRIIGSIRQSNTVLDPDHKEALYSLRVTNTFARARTVKISSKANHVIELINPDGNELYYYQQKLAPNESITIPIKARLRHGVTPSQPIEYIELFMELDDGTSVDCGRMKVNIGGNIVHNDKEAPIISNLRINYEDYVGNGTDDYGGFTLTWDASDQSQISDFVIQPYVVREDGSYSAAGPARHTNNDLSSYRFQIAGGKYFFSIYGVDAFGNKPSAGQCSQDVVSTGATSCLRSEDMNISWKVKINWQPVHIRPADLPAFVWRGKSVAMTLIPDKAWYNATHTKLYGRYPYDEYTHVYIGDDKTGIKLVNGDKSQLVWYSYNEKKGSLEVHASADVPEDLLIRATARVCWLGYSDV